MNDATGICIANYTNQCHREKDSITLLQSNIRGECAKCDLKFVRFVAIQFEHFQTESINRASLKLNDLYLKLTREKQNAKINRFGNQLVLIICWSAVKFSKIMVVTVF